MIFFSVPQALSHPFLCPVQRSADRAAADPPLFRDLLHVLLLEIVGKQYFFLFWSQLPVDHLFQSLELNLPW